MLQPRSPGYLPARLLRPFRRLLLVPVALVGAAGVLAVVLVAVVAVVVAVLVVDEATAVGPDVVARLFCRDEPVPDVDQAIEDGQEQVPVEVDMDEELGLAMDEPLELDHLLRELVLHRACLENHTRKKTKNI